MANHSLNLATAGEIAADYRDTNPTIHRLAVQLQLALLAAMTADLRKELPKRVSKPKLYDGLTEDEVRALFKYNSSLNASSGKIEAIKLIRQRKGRYTNQDGTAIDSNHPEYYDLRQAKDDVENWMYRNFKTTVCPLPGTADDFFHNYVRGNKSSVNASSFDGVFK